MFYNDNEIKKEFIVCYDKFTKPMAVSLRSTIGREKGKCVIWDKKTYMDNEHKLSSWNKTVLLNEELVRTNLANPELKGTKFSEGILLKHEGNTLGLYIDPEYEFLSFKQAFSESWKKYLKCMVLPVLLVGGVPGATIATLLSFRSDKNKVKWRLFFDAVNKLKGETIRRILSDEQVV